MSSGVLSAPADSAPLHGKTARGSSSRARLGALTLAQAESGKTILRSNDLAALVTYYGLEDLSENDDSTAEFDWSIYRRVTDEASLSYFDLVLRMDLGPRPRTSAPGFQGPFIHLELPDSLDAVYLEDGRGGQSMLISGERPAPASYLELFLNLRAMQEPGDVPIE
jgi:hypothetical protein